MDVFSTDSARMYFKVTIPRKGTDISLSAEMLNLLIALGENKTLNQISMETGQELTDLRTTLGKLIRIGLVEPVFRSTTKPKKYFGHTFLVSLRANLARAIGPMGDLIIDETLEAMNISNRQIPIYQAAELINNLSKKIPDEKLRKTFQNNMIAVIRKSRETKSMKGSQ